MDAYEKAFAVADIIGADEAYEALIRALSAEELEECMNFIIRCFDLDIDE